MTESDVKHLEFFFFLGKGDLKCPFIIRVRFGLNMILWLFLLIGYDFAVCKIELTVYSVCHNSVIKIFFTTFFFFFDVIQKGKIFLINNSNHCKQAYLI